MCVCVCVCECMCVVHVCASLILFLVYPSIADEVNVYSNSSFVQQFFCRWWWFVNHVLIVNDYCGKETVYFNTMLVYFFGLPQHS